MGVPDDIARPGVRKRLKGTSNILLSRSAKEFFRLYVEEFLACTSRSVWPVRRGVFSPVQGEKS